MRFILLSSQASRWYHAIAKEIQYQNIEALHRGSRSPEIIEWYYQYQSELYRRHNFLTKPTEVTLHVYSPFHGDGDNDDNPALFIVTVRYSISYGGFRLVGHRKRWNAARRYVFFFS